MDEYLFEEQQFCAYCKTPLLNVEPLEERTNDNVCNLCKIYHIEENFSSDEENAIECRDINDGTTKDIPHNANEYFQNLNLSKENVTCSENSIQNINERELFQCKVCTKEFAEKLSLENHMTIHTDERPSKYDLCKTNFTSSDGLQGHTRLQKGEKPYKCDVCEKGFRSRRGLEGHTRIHTGEKPFKCDECGKEFASKQCLKRDIVAHTGEKPYQCTLCEKSYGIKNDYNMHLRQVHADEKKYKCNICERTFKMEQSLRFHNCNPKGQSETSSI